MADGGAGWLCPGPPPWEVVSWEAGAKFYAHIIYKCLICYLQNETSCGISEFSEKGD